MMVTKGGPENVEVDESLNALERARHFGNSKLSLQRLVYVNELVDCAHEIGYDATVVHLLPLVQKLSTDSEVLVRQSLLGHFGDLAGFLIQSHPEIGYQKVVDELLPVISALLMEKQGEVRQSAADALTTLASHLRPGDRGDQVLMTVISLSHRDDDEDAKSMAVQLLNGLAEALGKDLCQQFVGVQLVALSQDPAVRVRKATAPNFTEVSRVVGEEYAVRRLLPAFQTLVRDQHWGVKKAAAESLVGFAMSLKAEQRQEAFVPMMEALLGDPSRWVRMAAVQQLGYFIACLEEGDRVPPEMLSQYIEIVEQAKSNPDTAEISYHAAYTFAAVAKTMGKAHWPELQTPFMTLCRDAQLKTRKAMAASAHVVAQAVGPELAELEVVPQYEVLLQDSSQEVRLAALRNVACVLRASPRDVPQRSVAKALQGSMAGKAENWRSRHLVASQLGAICQALGALPGLGTGQAGDGTLSPVGGGNGPDTGPREQPAHAKDIVWKVIVPIFLQLCGDGVAEVRDEAARATAKVLRAAASEMFADPGAGTGEGSGGLSLQRLPPQMACFVRHIKAFATGRCFRSRMAYIRMCDSIVRETPAQIFTDFFLWPLVRLTADPVKNVRLCWAATMVPHIRKGGRLGQIAALIAAACRMSKGENGDEEVKRVLSSAQFAELPDSRDAGQLELDFEETDACDVLANEGGTGDSSEHSDVGVEEPEEDCMEASASLPAGGRRARNEEAVVAVPATASSVAPAPHPLSATSPLGDSTGSSSEELPFHPPPRAAAVATVVLQAESPSPVPASSGASASSSSTSPVAGRAPPVSSAAWPATMPRSPQQRAADLISPTAAPARDLLEDSLVEQCEIDRDMDAAFVDRRLLHETTAEELEMEAHADLGIAATGSLPPAAGSTSEAASAPEAALAPAVVPATSAPEGVPVPEATPVPETLQVAPASEAAPVPAAEVVQAASEPEVAPHAVEAAPAPQATPVPEVTPVPEAPQAAPDAVLAASAPEAGEAPEAAQAPEVAQAPEAAPEPEADQAEPLLAPPPAPEPAPPAPEPAPPPAAELAPASQAARLPEVAPEADEVAPDAGAVAEVAPPPALEQEPLAQAAAAAAAEAKAPAQAPAEVAEASVEATVEQ